MGRRVNNGRLAVNGHPYKSSSWAKDLEKALKNDWKKKNLPASAQQIVPHRS